LICIFSAARHEVLELSAHSETFGIELASFSTTGFWGFRNNSRRSNGEGSAIAHAAFCQAQSGNFRIEAVGRQTMIGMLECEFPDR
jgi:hypothetical protein